MKIILLKGVQKIMKKLLIGFSALISMATFASETIKIHPSDISSISSEGEVKARMIGEDGNYLNETKLKGLDKECLEMAMKTFTNSNSKLTLEVSVKKTFKLESGTVWAPIFGSDQESCKLQSPYVKL